MDRASHSLFSRSEWARLRSRVPLMLNAEDLASIQGAGEILTLSEVEDVFLPLTRLINLHFGAKRRLTRVTSDFLARPAATVPYIIALAGSVAVGKSTTARLLQTLLARWSDHPKVSLVPTDGFLFSSERLKAEGLMNRKGFPESYDVRSMTSFLSDVRFTGQANSPVYSHEQYDIIPDQFIAIDNPDILIIEGLNVLQHNMSSANENSHLISTNRHFDLTIYVDAETEDIERWYVDRFLSLRKTTFTAPSSFFHSYAKVSEVEARDFARRIWNDINRPNLVENILPTRSRANIILHKDALHAVDQVWLSQL